MKQEDIIRMAREAGFDIGEFDRKESIFNPYTNDEQRLNAELERFAALVAAAENEECAKACEPQEEHDDPLTAWKIAKAIRARGQA